MIQILPAINEHGKPMPVCNYEIRPHQFTPALLPATSENIWLCAHCGAQLVISAPPSSEDTPRIRIESNGTRESTTVWVDGVNVDMKAIMFHASALEPEATWKLELV
ncbi:MAG: hypothetical protein C7B44_09745 [Sulfobacillus thermosulfidooxidans]|nr:MAG: hypothetical protein C7B44_09745 [Sulfobacillus thermosulfidooxidans]